MELTIEEVLKENQRLITKIVRKYITSDFDFELDDLFQEACLNIIKYYPKYDPSKSSLQHFLVQLTKYAIFNYYAKNKYGFHMQQFVSYITNKFYHYNLDFYQIHQREMTEKEKLEWLKENVSDQSINIKNLAKDIDFINYYGNRDFIVSVEDKVVRMEEILSQTENSEVASAVEKLLVSTNNMESEIIEKVDIERFLSSLTYLTSIEKKCFLEVLGLLDGIPKTFQTIGEETGVTRQTVHGNYQRALKKVRKRNKKNNLIQL